MKCVRSVEYLDQGEYTYIILKVLIRASLILWSCQLTDKKKFEHRLIKSATVKLSSDTDPSKVGHGQSRELRMKWGEAEQFGGKMHTAIITVKAFYN